MNWKTLLLITSVFFIAMPSEARWVEAQGTARIINGDTNAAREKP